MTYQDFVKYKQHLAMYLARFNLQIEDFGEGRKFASVTPHDEVSAGDHSKYVLAFFTVISHGDLHRVQGPRHRVRAAECGSDQSRVVQEQGVHDLGDCAGHAGER